MLHRVVRDDDEHALDSKRVRMGIKPSRKGPIPTSGRRIVATEVHRIRCAKSMTASTLYQYGARSSPECSVCNKRGDILHYLDECTKWSDERDVWRRSVESGGLGGDLMARMKDINMKDLVEFVSRTTRC